MMKMLVPVLLWFILRAVSWPLALIILVVYPVLWLLSLPFRLVGITINSLFKLVEALFTLPFRILKEGRA